ncbi:MAG: septal ring lytic transglycosylase RlpA family protein [Parvularculaceae bacterium]|nr:septal ring lytic transglycosylase RlpA family protein [Parvularculaceae bacterium]
MSARCYPQFRPWFFFVAATVLAACASSPREAGRPNPHYKLGAPYEINGRRYVPREDPDYVAVGTASWYGDEFHGKSTANGEIFDKRRLSAAHTTLPLPSLVEVENLDNGRRAILRVNDRGPFVGDRIIDLSHASAIALGFEKQGLAPVRVRYVGRADLYAQAPLLGERFAAAASSAPRPATGPSPSDAAPPSLATPAPPTPVTEDALPPVAAPPRPSVAEGPIPFEPATSEVWIVLDEFDDLAAAEVARSIVAPGEQVRITSPGSRARYSFEIGPYAARTAAEARLAALREAGYLEARLAGRTAAGASK